MKIVLLFIDLKLIELFVGSGLGPIQAYLDYKGIVQIAINSGCDAIHPGYGFLSENPDFADECAKYNILFVGPSSEIMRSLGNKVEAKKTANNAKVPTIPSNRTSSKRYK